MKDDVCPKCASREIIRIPGSVGAYGGGNNIPIGLTIFSSIKVTRYVCSHCGFSEEWMDSFEDLDNLKCKFGIEIH